MPNYTNYFNEIMAPLGMTAADLVKGCPECSGPGNWPEDRAIIYAYLVIAIYGLTNVVGEPPKITSGYRCAPCNERRGGAKRSRHLAGTSGGADYGAVDIQWGPGKIGVLLDNLTEIPAFVRAVTGLDIGVGVIAYKGSRRLHLDLRASDYVSDQR